MLACIFTIVKGKGTFNRVVQLIFTLINAALRIQSVLINRVVVLIFMKAKRVLMQYFLLWIALVLWTDWLLVFLWKFKTLIHRSLRLLNKNQERKH